MFNSNRWVPLIPSNGRRAAVEEDERRLSNQILRHFVSRACAVVQAFHVLYVASGGGHRHLIRAEVSIDTR